MNVLKAIQDYFKSNSSLPFLFREKLSQDARGEDAVVPMAVLAMSTADANGNVDVLGFTTRTVSYQLTAADAGKKTRMDKATGVNFTVPNNTTEPIPVGFQHIVRQVGVGQVTIVAASGVTIHSPGSLLLRAQGSDVALHKVGVNEWDASGDFAA